MQYVPDSLRRMATAAQAGITHITVHRSTNLIPAYAGANAGGAAPEANGYSLATRRNPSNSAVQAPERPLPDGTVVMYPSGNVIETLPLPETADQIITKPMATPVTAPSITTKPSKEVLRNKWTYIIGVPILAAAIIGGGIAYANRNADNVVVPPVIQTPEATATAVPTATATPIPIPTVDPLLASLPDGLKPYFAAGALSLIDSNHKAALAGYMKELYSQSPDAALVLTGFYAAHPGVVAAVEPRYIDEMTRLAQAVPLFTQDGDSITPDGLARTMKDLATPMPISVYPNSNDTSISRNPLDNLTEQELTDYIKLVATGFSQRGRDMPDDVFPRSMTIYDITTKSYNSGPDMVSPWEIAKKNISTLPAVTKENEAYLNDPNALIEGRWTPQEMSKARNDAYDALFAQSSGQLRADIDTIYTFGSTILIDAMKIYAKAYAENHDHDDFATFLSEIWSKALGIPVRAVAWDYPKPYLGVQHASLGVNLKNDYPNDAVILEASSPKKLLPIGSLETGLREDDAIAAGVPEMRVDGVAYWPPDKVNNQ